MSKVLRTGWTLAFLFAACATAAWAAASVTVNGTAAMNGTTFGMSINLDGTATNAFVQSDHPNDETHYLFRFFLNPGTAVVTPGTSIRIGAIGDDAGAVGQHIILFLRNDNAVVPNQFQLNFWYKDETAGGIYKFGGATYFTLVGSPCSRGYEVEWTRDTLAGTAGNGTLILRRLASTGTCTPTGLLTRTVSNMDNDAYQVDNARFGTLNNQAVNGNGSVYFDEFSSFR